MAQLTHGSNEGQDPQALVVFHYYYVDVFQIKVNFKPEIV